MSPATSPHRIATTEIPRTTPLTHRRPTADPAGTSESFSSTAILALIKELSCQVSSIEFTQIQSTVMHGLAMGNDVLKQLHAEMSLDKVERLMDQTREGIEHQRV